MVRYYEDVVDFIAHPRHASTDREHRRRHQDED